VFTLPCISHKASAQHECFQHAVIIPPDLRVGRGITVYEKPAIVLQQQAPKCPRFCIFNAVNKFCFNRCIISLSISDTGGRHIHLQRLITDLY